ncbi:MULTISPECIES: hypothetical protein [unclassified Haloferax]|uniref:hypothetical protein n=1 Tax=unclassified Haloferax TaxID=2625095 RepID=UPI0028764129|nr:MULTISPECIES: hypothetical protein [unclassified Haloferax]MDS0243545.1 hypothetical protein [Haloferax sp. S2CR25]MDS0446666.1 hypothetical protein [Haloferax sp. S2CR25-2]
MLCEVLNLEVDNIVYRSIDARTLVGEGGVDSEAYIASRLAVPDKSAVCVVLRYTDRLIHAAIQDVTSAERALVALNEQLASWEDENLLIVEDADERVHEIFPQVYSTDIYDLDKHR